MRVMVFAIADPAVELDQFKFQFQGFFHDETAEPFGAQWPIMLRAPFNVTPTALENLIEDGVLEVRDQRYPGVTLNRGDILMFDIKRGA